MSDAALPPNAHLFGPRPFPSNHISAPRQKDITLTGEMEVACERSNMFCSTELVTKTGRQIRAISALPPRENVTICQNQGPPASLPANGFPRGDSQSSTLLGPSAPEAVPSERGFQFIPKRRAEVPPWYCAPGCSSSSAALTTVHRLWRPGPGAGGEFQAPNRFPSPSMHIKVIMWCPDWYHSLATHGSDFTTSMTTGPIDRNE